MRGIQLTDEETQLGDLLPLIVVSDTYCAIGAVRVG